MPRANARRGGAPAATISPESWAFDDAAANLPADLAPFAQLPDSPIAPLLALATLPPFPTDAQVASFCNVSTRTLRRWRSKGLLKGIRLGDGHERTPRAEVARFIVVGCCNA
jgi:hypothetical protein